MKREMRVDGLVPAVLEAVPDAVVIVDARGRIRFVNGAATSMFGYDPAEVLSRRIEMLVPTAVRGQHVRLRRKFEQNPRPRPMGVGLDIVGRRSDGSEFPADIGLTPLPAQDGERLVVACVRDVTEHKRQEWLLASAEVTAALLSGDPDEALSVIARAARRVAGAHEAWIELPLGEHDVVVAACGGPHSAELRSEIVPLSEAPLLAEIAASGQPIVISDARADPRGSASTLARWLDLGPLVAIPLQSDGRCLGALVLGNRHDHMPFTAIDIEMAGAFAAKAALAVEAGHTAVDRQRLLVAEDRDRTARELHDVIIQRLFALGLRLQAISSRLPDSNARELAAITAALDATIDDIRDAIFSSETDTVPGPGLRQQLRSIAAHATARLGFPARIRFTGPVDHAVPASAHSHLATALSEALANAAQHAHATAVDVSVTVDERQVVLRVRDNGRGMPAVHTERGLANLRRRAEDLGGTLDTRADTGDSGLVFTWTIPIRPPAPRRLR